MRRRMVVIALTLLMSACGSGNDEGGSGDASSPPTSESVDGTPTTATPATEPVSTEPPDTEPPDTEPPDTEPPETEPPAAAVPDWTPAEWTADDLDTFSSLVSDAFAERDVEVEVDLERGLAAHPDGTTFGLINLAQTVGADPAGWSTTIAAHVDKVLASRGRDVSDLTFDDAAPLLRVRIGEPIAVGGDRFADRFVHRRIAGDLRAFVVVDFPESISYLDTSIAESWGVPVDDVFDLALAQTLRLPPPEVEEAGGVLLALGDIYTATLLLDPTRLVPTIDELGVVVAVSNADSIVITPARGITMDTIAQIAVLTRQDFTEYSNPASDDLYWWHNGTIEALAVTDTTIGLPPGLQDIVE